MDSRTTVSKLGLFLDDERSPSEITWIDYPEGISWYIVRTTRAFVDEIAATFEFNYEPYSVISFDCDLGNHNDDGTFCARHLCDKYLDRDLELPTCFIHSKNPEGAANIKSILDSYNKVRNEDIELQQVNAAKNEFDDNMRFFGDNKESI
jgi:hypothetical protein